MAKQATGLRRPVRGVSPRKLRATSGPSAYRITSISGYRRSSPRSRYGAWRTVRDMFLGWLSKLAHRFMRPPESSEPPPLHDLPLPDITERRHQLDEARLNIHHREQILRRLEARARFRGGVLGEDEK